MGPAQTPTTILSLAKSAEAFPEASKERKKRKKSDTGIMFRSLSHNFNHEKEPLCILFSPMRICSKC